MVGLDCVRVRVRDAVVNWSPPEEAAAAAAAISTCVRLMKSRIPETRRFMSFIVVRLGFICRGLDGLPFS